MAPLTTNKRTFTRQTLSVGTKYRELDTPIHALLEQFRSQFQGQFHLPNPQILFAIYGALAANCLSGPPTWLMVVGNSSGGKTLCLKSLLGISPRVRPVSSISGESAFLSGTDRKKQAKDATGGLLNELGNNGCLLFLDFTTLMSKSTEEVTSMMGTLRQMYDGDFIRDVGSEGGRSLRHTGRIGLLAGVTNIIDMKDEVSREMGARALYYRPVQTAGYQEGMAAVNQTFPEGMMADLQNLVSTMFYVAGLSLENPIERRKLDLETADRIVSIAQFASKARSHVPRDWKTNVVSDVATVEQAPRMAQEMAQLFCGMEALGLGEEDRWAVIEKCALDSMSNVRRGILEALKEAEGEGKGGGEGAESRGNKLVEIAKRVQVNPIIVGRTLEDLEILGIVQRVDKESEEVGSKPMEIPRGGGGVGGVGIGGSGNGSGSGSVFDSNGYPRPQRVMRKEKGGSGGGTGGGWSRENPTQSMSLVPGAMITGESGWGLTQWTRDKLKLTETKAIEGKSWE